MFSEDKFESIQDDLLRIELQKKFGGKYHVLRKIMRSCHSVTSSGPQEPSLLSSSSAFSTLKRLITNKSSVPAVARQLSTFLPALLPGLARSHQPPPILPWLPPLEVELTEDPDLALDLASSSPDHSSMSSADPALSITVSPDPGLDQIPSTINSLSPRSNRNSR